jgi:hypothetical protein
MPTTLPNSGIDRTRANSTSPSELELPVGSPCCHATGWPAQAVLAVAAQPTARLQDHPRRTRASGGIVRPYLSAVIRLHQNVIDWHAGVAALYHQTHPTR